MSYKLKGSSVYDTNPLTRSDDFSNDTIIGVETRGSVVFTHEKPNQMFDAELALTRNQFNESEFNSNDASLALRASKKIKRWILSLNGLANRDTTRASSTDTLGQNNIVVGRRTTYSMAPSLVYNYSPRNSLGINTEWTQRDYAEETRLTDHRTYSISPYVARKLSRLQTLSLALLYQNYTATSGPKVDVNSIGPFLTWQYNFMPTTLFEFSFGLLRTDFSGFGTTGGSEVNPIYTAKIENQGQIHTTSLSLERARRASSNGSELDTTSAEFKDTMQVTPRWDINFTAKYTDAQQSGFSTENLDKSYSGSIAASYEVSRNMKFSTSYRYINESFTDNSSDATRNVIRASLEYAM